MKLEMNMGAVLAPHLLQITRSTKPFTEPAGGFDLRMVRYEAIHGIDAREFDELVKIVEPKDGQTILDAGSGYGSVSRELLARSPDVDIDLILYDLHEVQLQRAIEEFSDSSKAEPRDERIKLIHGDVRDLDLPDESVDTIIAKMVIHEIPEGDQSDVFHEFYRVLKPGGELIIWEPCLSRLTQKFFQDVIKIKDVLASFDHLVGTRYFPREEELLILASANGFSRFRKRHSFIYKLNTAKRLDAELGGDSNKLSSWHNVIRMEAKKLSTAVLDKLHYLDKGDSIEFQIRKAIFSCRK